jgi:hypothetical protein
VKNLKLFSALPSFTEMQALRTVLSVVALGVASSTAFAESDQIVPVKPQKSDISAEVKMVSSFLELINSKYAARECLRDEKLLNVDRSQLGSALMTEFIYVPELRRDLREIAMRFAAFIPFPPQAKIKEIPIGQSASEKQKQLRDVVLDVRKRLWVQLDALEAKYPSKKKDVSASSQGLIITVEDRGWRPETPNDTFELLYIGCSPNA